MTRMASDALKNNLGNPARGYLWEVLFPNPASGNTETLLLRARSSTIPGVSVSTINIPFKQCADIVVPGKKVFSHEWSCSFIEGEDREIWNTFYAETQAIVNAETGLGEFAIKKDVYLHLQDTDGTISKRIKLVGTFVKSQDDIAVNYEDTGEIIVHITFAYDYWVEA